MAFGRLSEIFWKITHRGSRREDPTLGLYLDGLRRLTRSLKGQNATLEEDNRRLAEEIKNTPPRKRLFSPGSYTESERDH